MSNILKSSMGTEILSYFSSYFSDFYSSSRGLANVGVGLTTKEIVLSFIIDEGANDSSTLVGTLVARVVVLVSNWSLSSSSSSYGFISLHSYSISSGLVSVTYCLTTYSSFTSEIGIT